MTEPLAGPAPPPPSRPRRRASLHLVYFALAAFDVLAVSLGLYLSNEAARVYQESVEDNQEWASRQLRFLELGRLASAVNAPGNDVFDSRDVPGERARTIAAARDFDTRLATLERDLPRENSPGVEALHRDLAALRQAMGEMRGEAARIFAHLEDAKPALAAQRMATMDRDYAGVRSAIDALGRDVAVEQARLLAAQTADAGRLQQSEYLIAACILIMVVTAIVYGNRVATRMHDDAEDRDRHLAALQASAEALAEAKRRAEEANEVKGVFLATMSHELRTPLNAVIGYSEMLADEARDQGHDGAVADLGRITDAGRHLLTLVNDILDLSKIEANRLELETRRVDVTALARDAAETVRGLMHANGNQLTVQCGSDVGVIDTDSTRLRQVLLNLLSNAAKFTERGTVALTVVRVAGDDGSARLEFRVSDTGIGIAPDRLVRLFAPFVQADPSMTRRYGGSGLGLAISRELCRKMGGDITVTSTPGEGSTFCAWVPAECAGDVPVANAA